MPPQKRTYFLPPSWSVPPSALPLGSILTHPTQPPLPIFVPATPPPTITTVSHPGPFSGKPPLHRDGGITGLFGTFLELHGLGDEDPPASLAYDRHAVLGYELRGVTTARFAPSEELKAEVLADGGRVRAYLDAAHGKGRVFMVIGTKSLEGAGVTVPSGKGGGWRVQLGVGVEEGQGEGVVFAFEVVELGLPVGEGDGGLLGEGEGLEERLEGVFGEGTVKVWDEGVDETEEGGECRIVAATTGCVDLLTASSARIGGK